MSDLLPIFAHALAALTLILAIASVYLLARVIAEKSRTKVVAVRVRSMRSWTNQTSSDDQPLRVSWPPRGPPVPLLRPLSRWPRD